MRGSCFVALWSKYDFCRKSLEIQVCNKLSVIAAETSHIQDGCLATMQHSGHAERNGIFLFFITSYTQMADEREKSVKTRKYCCRYMERK